MIANVFLYICAMLVVGQNAKLQNIDGWLAKLVSTESTESAVDYFLAADHKDELLTQRLDRELPAMLLNAPNPRVIWSEARVAGAFKIEASIPSLVKLLDQTNQGLSNGTFYMFAQLQNDPIARALYDIGPASIAPVGVALENGTTFGRMRAARILLLFNTSESREILKTWSVKEPDPDLKKFLVSNVASFGRYPVSGGKK